MLAQLSVTGRIALFLALLSAGSPFIETTPTPAPRTNSTPPASPSRALSGGSDGDSVGSSSSSFIGSFYIYSWENNLPTYTYNYVLEITGGSTASGASAAMNYYTGGSHQKWTMTGGQLKNVKSGLCLATTAATSGNSCSKSLTQVACSGATAWKYTRNSTIVGSDGTGQCLHVGGGSTVAGAQVWTCTSSPQSLMCGESSTETWGLGAV